MELRHVRYFVAVAESLSFTKGAEKLRIAQPSLTRQIKHLEEELGVRLLNRSTKEVTLTNEGECFLAGARRLLSYSADIIESLHSLARPKLAAINIGYVPHPFHRALPASLALYEKQFPEVSINLFSMPSLEQVRSLREGKIDLGFVGLLEPEDAPGLELRTAASYEVVVLTPKKHRVAKKRVIGLKELTPMLFISLSDNCYHGYGRWLKKTCEAAGFKPRVVQTVDNETILLQAIRSALGVALLPGQIRSVEHENVAIRNLRPPIQIDSVAAWRRDNESKELRDYLKVIDRVRQKWSNPLGDRIG
jgi:DNA-binding transcriptional LysR family regulator